MASTGKNVVSILAEANFDRHFNAPPAGSQG